VTATAKVSAMLCLATALALGMMTTMTSTVSAQGQEEMNQALEHLRHAKAALEHAEHDKGGHREAAMRLIDQAIREVEAGKAYAREHPEHHD